METQRWVDQRGTLNGEGSEGARGRCATEVHEREVGRKREGLPHEGGLRLIISRAFHLMVVLFSQGQELDSCELWWRMTCLLEVILDRRIS